MARPVYEREVTRRRSRLIREPVPAPEPVVQPVAAEPDPEATPEPAPEPGPEVSNPDGLTLAEVRGFVTASAAYGAPDDTLVAEGSRILKALRLAKAVRSGYAQGGIIAHKPVPEPHRRPGTPPPPAAASVPAGVRRPMKDSTTEATPVVNVTTDDQAAPTPLELLNRAAFAQEQRARRARP